MNSAYLLEKAPIRVKGEKISLPHVLARIIDTDLEEASDEERLQCCTCLETVFLVHRDKKPNHFRHRRCDLRSKAHLREAQEVQQVNVRLTVQLEMARKSIAQLNDELEQARQMIVHLTNEAKQAEEIIHHVEDGLKKAA